MDDGNSVCDNMSRKVVFVRNVINMCHKENTEDKPKFRKTETEKSFRKHSMKLKRQN